MVHLTTESMFDRKERQEFLIDRKHFVCHCRFCFEDAEDENDLKFYGMFRELENLKIYRGVGSDTFESDDSCQAYQGKTRLFYVNIFSWSNFLSWVVLLSKSGKLLFWKLINESELSF